MSIRLPSDGMTEARMLFLMSLWRWPITCKSSVSTSALQPAARVRSIMADMAERSRIMYSWNQKGAVVFCATSSMEQMLMVDRVNGMPNFSAARAALISPSALCMPVRPTGAMHTGIFTSMPTILVAVLRPSMFTATRWRSLMRWKSSELAR